MKTKKLLSILLALMMMLSVVPMYASAAEALNTASIQTLPTISMKTPDVLSYIYGTTYEEIFAIADDEVVVDAAGNQVAGHFELKAPNACWDPSVETLKRINLVFVPDDTTAYSGFNKNRVSVESFGITIQKSTMKLVDETNDPPVVQGSYASGTLLSEITITGGVVVNTINPEANQGISNPPLWRFVNADQAITESGYYTAYVAGAEQFFETFEYPVYVQIAKNMPLIVDAPVATLTVGDDLNNVVLEGGKVMCGDVEVRGTFTFENPSQIVNSVGTYPFAIIFTPDDTENYSTCTGTATVTVNPAPIKFVDENGNEIVPEITVDYGTEVGDYINLFKGFATNCNETLRFTLTDEVKNAVPTVGTHEYEVTAATFKTVGVTSKYEDTVLKFKVIVEPMELAVKFLTETGGQTNPNYCEIGVTSNVLSARPQGTFAIYVDGVLLKDGLKYHEKVEWPVAVSKTYELKAVYTPVDNDPYIIEDYTGTIKKNLYWMFTSGKNVSGPSDLIACGATVDISANLTSENFAGWKVTNAAGEEVDLGLDNTSVKATITMPDYDITVEALEKNASSGGSGGIFDMDFGDLSEGDSEWAIINIIRNIIAMFKSFLQQLIETFQSIGD